MAIDRNLLEQEALALLNRGQVDKALNRYQALLRADPRDRRIRQKVAELLLRLGRRQEGERMLREVADSYVTEGQHRAAVAVLKQLLELNPEDADLEGQLGTCYQAAGFPTEARRCLEGAVRRLSKTDPVRGVVYLRQLIRLSGGDAALQVQMAELLDAAGQKAEALEAWRALAADAKKRGRNDDLQRFVEAALKSAPEDVELLCEGAEARFANGDARGALGHVQKAYAIEKQSARVLSLLARALDEGGMGAKARPVYLQAARLFETDGNATARAEALQRALALGPEDAEVRAMLGEAAQAASRAQLRLDDKPWAAPKTEAEVRAVVRARTLARYGFGDRALDVLKSADPSIRTTISVHVALAELLVERGDVNGALAELKAVPPLSDETARDQLRTRVLVLGGGPQTPYEAEIDENELDEIDDDALESMSSEFTGSDPEDAETGEEEISDAEDDEIVEDDPTEDTPVQKAVVVKTVKAPRKGGPGTVASLFAPPTTPTPTGGGMPGGAASLKVGVKKAVRPRDKAPPLPSSIAASPDTVIMALEEGAPAFIHHTTEEMPTMADIPGFFDPMDMKPDFSDLFPPTPSLEIFEDFEEPTAPSAKHEEVSLDEARALLSAGLFAEARNKVVDRVDLPAVVVLAAALKGMGENAAAAERLRSSLSEAAETDAGYLDALFALAQLDAHTRKTRSAARLIGELIDLDPNYRRQEVADLKRGIEIMIKSGR